MTSGKREQAQQRKLQKADSEHKCKRETWNKQCAVKYGQVWRGAAACRRKGEYARHRSGYLTSATRLRLAFPNGPMEATSSAARHLSISRAAVDLSRKSVAGLYDLTIDKRLKCTLAKWKYHQPLYIAVFSVDAKHIRTHSVNAATGRVCEPIL